MPYSYKAKNDGTCPWCQKPFRKGDHVATATQGWTGYVVVHYECMAARLKKPRAIEVPPVQPQVQ